MFQDVSGSFKGVLEAAQAFRSVPRGFREISEAFFGFQKVLEGVLFDYKCFQVSSEEISEGF